MQIERIPFPPIGSNMYVVTQGRDAIVLDPWPDEATMQRLQGYHALIVLTHEHIDHISGLGRMQRALSARTLWQENCTPWLRNPGNTTPVLLAALSVSRGAEARDFLRGLRLKTETYAPDMTFGDHIALDWGALHLEGYATPGHSRGSVKVDAVYPNLQLAFVFQRRLARAGLCRHYAPARGRRRRAHGQDRAVSARAAARAHALSRPRPLRHVARRGAREHGLVSGATAASAGARIAAKRLDTRVKLC